MGAGGVENQDVTGSGNGGVCGSGSANQNFILKINFE